MHYSENYHLNKPDLADQYNVSHWNENTEILDSVINNLSNQVETNRNVSRLIGTLPINQGGTGQTTKQNSLNALHEDVPTINSVNENDEITFIRRTQADASQGISESVDVKDATLNTIANKVFEILKSNNSNVFNSNNNGLVPKANSASVINFLRADGQWDSPKFMENKFNLSSNGQLSPSYHTIYTFTSSNELAIVLNDGVNQGQTVTFFNPNNNTHTISLKFFGGNSTAYIKPNSTMKLWWTGSEWLNVNLQSYEINSLYQSFDATSPANLFGGTWEKLPDGVFIRNAGGDAGEVGQLQGEGLPNLEGWVQVPDTNSHGSGGALDGILFQDELKGVSDWSGSNYENHDAFCFSFNAHRYNSIYGSSDHVTPYNMAVYMWKRTA